MLLYKSSIFYFLFSLFMFFSLSPFYIWGYYQLSYLLFLFLTVTSYFVCFKLSRISTNDVLLALLIFCICMTYNILSNTSFAGAIFFSFAVSMLTFLTREDIKRAYKSFSLLYAWLLLPGCIIWIIHVLTGDNQLFSLGRIEPEIIPNQLKVDAGEGYIKYPFMVVLDYMLALPVYRFMGPFDEPGVLGTISALLLSADKLNLNKKSNKIIFFSGLISLSLAFYVLISLYFILAMVLKLNRRNILFIILAVLSFFILSMNDTFQQLILSRMSSSGDNRSSTSLTDAFYFWVQNDNIHIFLFGIRDYIFDGSSSWMTIPIHTGAIGVLSLCLIYVLAWLRYSNFFDKVRSHNVFIFLLVFISSIYQRPDIAKAIFMFIFIYGVQNHRSSYTELN